MKYILFSALIGSHLISAAPLTLLTAKERYDAYRAQAYLNQKAVLESRESGCNLNSVIVRKEWSTLSLGERKEYTDSVMCLSKKGSIKPENVVAPGIRNRYDDFHANHINQTVFIHFSKGAQPYWDWSAEDVTPASNALFAGGEGSIGGNGESIPHEGPIVMIPTTPPTVSRIAPGTGGGCIFDGPFVNLTNNIGPYGPPQVSTAFDYNPRCIKRDFRPDGTKTSLTYEKVTNILDQTDLDTFQAALESSVHPGGHVGIGGQQDDLYSGNGDPAFYFHHAQVDHVWNIWQAQNFATRTNLVSGTLTIRNTPPSENGTLETTMDLGYNGPTYAIRDLVSTIDGPLCYIYK